eukprot:GHUV01035582.1.p1 GENE.GHUV01035582.1~~GHUV01035582.1.p1  ORF type:complete len:101 (-),score=8.58 GHUV01035582.1:19-321(-)
MMPRAWGKYQQALQYAVQCPESNSVSEAHRDVVFYGCHHFLKHAAVVSCSLVSPLPHVEPHSSLGIKATFYDLQEPRGQTNSGATGALTMSGALQDTAGT